MYDAAGNLNYRTNNAFIQTFNTDSLNQLTTINRSGTLTVAGNTTSTATNVTVNSLTATRYADNTWAKESFPLVDATTNFAAIAKTSMGLADTNTVMVDLRATNSFIYDLNGNLVSDGKRGFDYDDENQLIRVTVTNAWKSELAYDGRFRRQTTKEFGWQGGTWVQTNETRLVYDGNVILQERDSSNQPVVTYTRGIDFSGTFDGAGGIGGLLARSESAASTAQTAFYHADGNGNITCLISTNQLLVARYAYDPFGNILLLAGPLAEANTMQFSSLPKHRSGLVLYLRRAYDPNLQRWLNQDPIGERGGLNLHEFIGNNPISFWDVLGLTCCDKDEIAKQKDRLIRSYRLAKDILEFRGIPHGGSGAFSCDAVNNPILNFIVKGITCWNCREERRSRYISTLQAPGYGNRWKDHWAVVCVSNDKSESILFDYWGNRPAGENPSIWFDKKYPVPGATQFQESPNEWYHYPIPGGNCPRTSPTIPRTPAPTRIEGNAGAW